MAANQGDDKPSTHPFSELFENLSEEKRKLLEALLKKQRATEKQSAGAADPEPDAGPHSGPRQNPWADPGLNPYAQAGAPPWTQLWQYLNPNAYAPYQQNPGWTPPPFQQGPSPSSRQGDLGGRCERSAPPPPEAILVAMKTSGSRPPFFCVHAVFGSAFPYFHLAKHMPENQPFYGLQSPGLIGEREPLDKVEDMAALYIEAIRKIQPCGPYQLGGYSFGGWIAFEMAQQLAKLGEKTSLLAMIGAGIPISVANPPLFEQLDYFINYLDDFQKLVLNSLLPEQTRLEMHQYGTQHPLLSPPLCVLQANNRAQLRYIPRPYGAGLTVFTTSEQHNGYLPDPSLGWKMLCTEEIESVPVSGNHLNIFYEPHVIELAEQLTRCLQKAQGDSA